MTSLHNYILGNKATLLMCGTHQYNVSRSNQPSTKCDFQTFQGAGYGIVHPFSMSAPWNEFWGIIINCGLLFPLCFAHTNHSVINMYIASRPTYLYTNLHQRWLRIGLHDAHSHLGQISLMLAVIVNLVHSRQLIPKHFQQCTPIYTHVQRNTQLTAGGTNQHTKSSVSIRVGRLP